MSQDHYDYPLSVDQLSSLHNPKSIHAFATLFHDNESNLYKYLNTHKTNGIHQLTDYHQSNRYSKYKDNRIPKRVPKTFYQLIWEAFNDKTMLLLTGAAIVSFALGMYELLFQPPAFDPEGNKIKKVDWVEGIAIMLAVVVVVVVGAANDYQKELQFVKLNEKKENRKIIVIRDNKELLVSIYDLLVGDLVNLQTGDVVPADSILVSGTCEVDESTITGETETIKKFPLSHVLKINHNDKSIDIGSVDSNGDKFPDCMLISGSKLLSGLGKAIVTSVGENSIHGKTMMSLNVEPESTPLQERLSQLADSISVYGCIAALFLFLVLFIRFLFYVLSPHGRFHHLDPAQRGNKFMNIFITAITIIVVAVPEGLPLAVTLALAFATTRMTKDGNLVRVLRACETMGSATAVCSDKTGTLTENVMTVVKGLFGNTHFDDSEPTESDSKELFQNTSESLISDVYTNVILNSTAFENSEYTPENAIDRDDTDANNGSSEEDLLTKISEGRQEPYIGSKTETALLRLARKSMNLKFGTLQNLRDNTVENFNIEEIVQIIPFESSRKWSGIIVKYKDCDNYKLYVKGAAEIVSNNCKYQKNSNNDELIEIDRNEINQEIEKLAVGALRAISLAHMNFDNVTEWPPADLKDTDNPNFVSPGLISKYDRSDLVLDGIVGIQDPLRPQVKDSVKQCQNAGVTVRMITGDNLLTARAIARNCNILTTETFQDPEYSIEGPKFRTLTKEERLRVLPNLRVMARSSPEDKRLLVETLKRMGEVVAVTGDGTNDAPALKLADVGFSMGISGTEVAREASDIVLMTDDFSAIVNAIKWGRCVSISIKKFIQFQLIVNVTAVILTFVSAVASEDESSVLTAVQLLWVNLIMDTLAALALATDKPDPNIMNRKPKGRSTPLIAASTWKMILGQSTLQLIVTFVLHFHGQALFFPHKKKITGHEQQQLNAMTFNTFVWLQFFTLLVSRKLDECDEITNWKDRISQVNLNFFQDLFRNYYFLVIMAIIGCFQVLIMFFGGAPFSIAPQTKAMWETAILCGMLSLPVGVIIRICPDELALKFFPSKAFNKCKYILTFEFIRGRIDKSKSADEEALLNDDESTESSSAFF
ncbi:hypothetical protein KAFR_0F03360 [Kazachstania africana CBS 2517]|uniref:Calcium-transporting ATPase n=1 Tax=Kazachstania africana (strain ATCC 22294 / BCRC 22015 / CBS 2517 / CECT 1963 / NBRC 1671 / NRRL Y-8276) TaxID=1071382 RepID=H2AX32_KAZAF|nr:hypothetical protein KAFR_0F03360 [Kazachstania africana CBS 2517]CCF58932.1 hypothetical protein KAFR_0F03360 [Kazachstania africana CBS 2517]